MVHSREGINQTSAGGRLQGLADWARSACSELAGLVVRLAQGGYRHVGCPECMVKRCGRGER